MGEQARWSPKGSGHGCCHGHRSHCSLHVVRWPCVTSWLGSMSVDGRCSVKASASSMYLL